MNSPVARRCAGLTATLVAGCVTALGAAPAQAATCDPDSTPVVATIATPTVGLGGKLRLTGTGWCHPDSGGSVIGVKIDDGAYSRLDTTVNANKTVWAIIRADADGTFSTSITLPDGTTNTSSPKLPTGSHTLRLLTGSLKSGDEIRTYESEPFDVVDELGSVVPRISGTAQVGRRLTAQAGTWVTGTKLTYQWLRNGAAIKGATTKTYAVVAADVANRLAVRVTGAKSGEASVTRQSARTAAVKKGVLKTAVPRITGTARVGRKLTAAPGSWTSGARLTYQWRANGKAIAGARSKTLKVVAKLRGKRITVKVTGTKAGYATASRVSKVTAPVRR